MHVKPGAPQREAESTAVATQASSWGLPLSAGGRRGDLVSEVLKLPDSGPHQTEPRSCSHPAEAPQFLKFWGVQQVAFPPALIQRGLVQPINRALGSVCALDRVGSWGKSHLSACFLMSKTEELEVPVMAQQKQI